MSEAGRPAFVGRLAAAEPGERFSLLGAFVEEEAAGVLGLPKAQVTLKAPIDLFDSAKALQLRSRLERSLVITLSATFLWEGLATLEDLVRLLMVKLALPDPRPRRASSRADAAPSRPPVAILGLAGRFPGARSAPAYWDLLRRGEDAITEIPRERWDPAALHSPRWGGFIEDIDKFDAGFFGISRREANRMDPQQRQLLEVAWEALEDAGQTAEALSGSRAGVFVGMQNFDYGVMNLREPADLEMYHYTGSLLSAAAGRIAYYLNLKGPATAVDSACSSSLVAVHLACQSLRAGESSLAVVGGVHVILRPHLQIAFSKSGALSSDGRCRPFDSGANGIVRSEGCGVVVLKLLSAALADGDPVRAVIRGSAVNHGGRGAGFTAPNSRAQAEVYRQALEDARLAPGDVSYVEAHGTGTSLGDPIELQSLKEVYGDVAAPSPCWVGSVKGNIGHAISAAGMAGLIKTVLALEEREIPATIHFERLNPNVSLDGTRLSIARERREWPRAGASRRAAVSAFGISGTNAHVLLEEGPEAAGSGGDRADGPLLLIFSAKTDEALRSLARSYRDLVSATRDSLRDVCYTAAVRRTHHDHRAAVSFRTRDELLTRLEAVASGDPSGLYARDYPVDWEGFFSARGSCVRLPSYPWRRQSYWLDAPK